MLKEFVQVVLPDVTETTYTYNGDGLRTSRSVTNASGSSQIVNYILDGASFTTPARVGSRERIPNQRISFPRVLVAHAG